MNQSFSALDLNYVGPTSISETDPSSSRSSSESSSSLSPSRSESESSDSQSSKSKDDEIIHFDWHRGLFLGDSQRYEVKRKLGDGTFGRVVECADRILGLRVAVKIIRDVKRYVANARVEARILERVNEIRRLTASHPGGRGIVRLFDIFVHEGRFFCMSFERLGKTLFEVIQMNNYCGFYLSDIQKISIELLETIDFIHSCCGLTHTDIKMENVMLCGDDFFVTDAPPRCNRTMEYRRPVLIGDSSNGRHRSIRLIDFGNGVFRGDHHSSTVNTRQYRSPEVILEQGWDEKSDIWSVGCVIGEMFTGELLFPTHANMEHLAMIERITGEQFTPEYFDHSPWDVRKRYVDRDGWLNWPEGCESRESFKHVDECLPLDRLTRKAPSLGSMLSKLLRLDPKSRYSANDALDLCPFLQKLIPDDI